MNLEENIKKLKISWPLVLTIIGGIGFSLLIWFVPEFSSYGAAFLLSSLAFWLLVIVDNRIFAGIDTIQELKNANIAVGLLILSESIVIVGCIFAAFLIFK